MTTTAKATLPTPPGYASLIPFDTVAHRKLGVSTEQQFSFGKSLNAIYLSAIEFAQASRHFPIVFSGSEKNNDVVPMVVTGLKNDRNLFINEDGSWADNVYIPAYLRRYPFYTAQIKRDNEEIEHIICVDPTGLVKDQPALVDSSGKTTDEWSNMENFIREMEVARQQTLLFTNKLVELDLLEPFEAQVHENSGKEFRVRGINRISTDRLKKLAGKALKDLVKNDYLFLIDIHRMSMDNFRLLLDRAK